MVIPMIKDTIFTPRNLTTLDTRTFDALVSCAPATDDLLELAAWLHAHGAAHLSAIERIELAERLITRRRFLIGAGVLAVGAITGCGAPSASAPTAAPAAMRAVQTQKGIVQVPSDPQRVLATYTTDADFALVLGLPLVGAGTARGTAGQGFAAHQPADALAGVTPLAIFPSANYEQFALLQPDLIISAYVVEENGYALLSQIAPTIWHEQETDAGWRVGLRFLAAATGREAIGERFIADFDARVARLRPLVAQRWGEQRALLLNPFGGLTIMQADSNMAVLYDELGFAKAASVPATFAERNERGLSQISLERLDLLADVDLLLLWRNPSADGTGRDPDEWRTILASPLYQQIPAVQKGQVFDVDAEWFYRSPLTAAVMLDFVERELLA